MIPNEMKRYNHWVCWKYVDIHGKKTKVPFTPNTGRKARSNDPKTWGTYEDALEMSKYYEGLGFVFTKEAPFVGIDIDHCIDETGNLTELAFEIIEKASSYTEVSPSGTGIHIIGKGELPFGYTGKRSTVIEVYKSTRFFTMTGKAYPNTTETVESVQSVIDEVFEKYFKKEDAKVDEAKAAYDVSFEAQAASDSDIEFLEEVIFKQKDGNLLRDLFNGENPKFGGDRSKNDLFFCLKLNWANNNDLNQTDRIFRSSGRMRPKWDERHFSNGETYGQATLRKSVSLNPKIQWKKKKGAENK